MGANELCWQMSPVPLFLALLLTSPAWIIEIPTKTTESNKMQTASFFAFFISNPLPPSAAKLLSKPANSFLECFQLAGIELPV